MFFLMLEFIIIELQKILKSTIGVDLFFFFPSGVVKEYVGTKDGQILMRITDQRRPNEIVLAGRSGGRRKTTRWTIGKLAAGTC